MTDADARSAAAPSEVLPVTAGDGATSEARVFAPRTEAEHAILFMPAMGTPARAYDRFGAALAARGVGVVLGDHRGTGSSALRASRKVDFGYAEMLERDWPALVAILASRFPRARAIVGGHSLGGQLAMLHVARAGGPEDVALVA